MKKILVLLLFLPMFVAAQSTDQNYVKSTSFTDKYDINVVKNTPASVLEKDKIETITYFDGLGRPMQSIGVRAGGDGKDIITHIGYDSFGRQTKEYLPYAEVTNGGGFRTGASGATNIFYNKTKYENTLNPFSEKELENSPLNRVFEQGAPGADWKLGNDVAGSLHTDGNTIKFVYDTNSANEVRLYTASTVLSAGVFVPSFEDDGYYSVNQLYKTITKDENWKITDGLKHTTEEFKNKQGQVVLKRTYADIDLNSNGNIEANEKDQKHDTYYVYDDYGNLTYVLPPKVNTADGVSNDELLKLSYLYVYDIRNRLVEKKIPGKGRESIVYDKLDRPVLTQDTLQKINNKWLFTKYDALGRVVYTGIHTNTVKTTREDMQSYFDSQNNTANKLYETSQGSSTDYADTYYSNNNFPDADLEIHTINYYDSYDFAASSSLSKPSTVWTNNDVTNKTKGLPTGSKVRVLDTNDWITTLTAYDKKGRAIWIGSHNSYLNTTDIVKSDLDFVGKADKVISIHSKDSEDDIVVIDEFVYDDMGRLLTQVQRVGNTEAEVTNSIELITGSAGDQTYISSGSITLKPDFIATPGFHAKINASAQAEEEELIVSNTYDELGQLESKGVGNKASSATRLQTVKYKYNIRGWLKEINDPTSIGNDLFAFTIKYNTGTNALYNGNISSTQWKTANTDSGLKTYNCTYDALNRITRAIDNTMNQDYSLQNIAYDKNGNILELKRRGHTSVDANGIPLTYGVMDDLTYTYDTGNRLLKVADAATSDQFGFKDDAVDTASDTSDDYSYDENGNMETDTNKGITGILYNHLNLPKEVQFGATNKIKYLYDAAGVKLQKTVIESGKADIVTKYAGNYIYKDDELEFFSHPEGYINPELISGSTRYNYIYQYKDHLGNIRLSYTDKNQKNSSAVDLEIVEENNYYPFGLSHKGYNNNISSSGNATAQKRKFGGKELQDELNLEWYDVSARNYDPALGRWMNLDPLAEDMTRHSPYNYAFDNPVYYVDYDGMSPFDNYKIQSNGNIVVEKTDDKTDTFTYTDKSGKTHEIGTYKKNENGLIQIPSIAYESGDVSVNISTKEGNEDRQFISGQALGSLIGASADSGQEIAVVSASESDGSSPSPSKSHKDGKNLDLRYAGKDGARSAINYEGSKTNFDKIDTKASASMNASLKKFGYKDIKSSTLKVSTTSVGKDGKPATTTSNYSVPGTSHLKNHYDHQHLQGYRPNIRTQKAISTRIAPLVKISPNL